MVNLFKQKPLKCSINSFQLFSAQVSFIGGIFRCKNAVFHQRGERVFKFSQERVRNALGTRLERVPDAFRAQMERERTVRLFLSSTVHVNFDNFVLYLQSAETLAHMYT